jgi:hypothetical protein
MRPRICARPFAKKKQWSKKTEKPDFNWCIVTNSPGFLFDSMSENLGVCTLGTNFTFCHLKLWKGLRGYVHALAVPVFLAGDSSRCVEFY